MQLRNVCTSMILESLFYPRELLLCSAAASWRWVGALVHHLLVGVVVVRVSCVPPALRRPHDVLVSSVAAKAVSARRQPRADAQRSAEVAGCCCAAETAKMRPLARRLRRTADNTDHLKLSRIGLVMAERFATLRSA